MPRTILNGRWAQLAGGAVALTLVGGAAAYAAIPANDHGDARRSQTDKTAEIVDAIKAGPAKNVILLIGDGMGDSEITIARNYEKGAAGSFDGIDALPLTGQMTHYSVHKKGTTLNGVDVSGLPDYDSESASTSSAWSTGTKTYDGSLSIDIDGVPQATLMELAKAKGLKIGNVTTSEIQDATPAGMYAHTPARGCYAPARLTAACIGTGTSTNPQYKSITEQLLSLRPDVVFGGGSNYFKAELDGKDNKVGSKTLGELSAEAGYYDVNDAAKLVDTKEELAALTTTPALGLFAGGNLPTRYKSALATNGGLKRTPVACEANPSRPATQPKLSEMTDKAIQLLDNSKGFFLQVEGASIDKRNHAADACGQIGETADLDEAVKVALDFAKADGNTSVFVTADHAHTSQIIELSATNYTPGVSIALKTREGSVMAVNYGTQQTIDDKGTPDTSDDEVTIADGSGPHASFSTQHTGAQVRLAGYGPGAANVIGLTDNTDLFFNIKRLLQLGENPGVNVPKPESTKTETRTEQVVPATVKEDVARKIKALSKKVKKAKGTKKKTLQAELKAYRALQKKLQ